MLPYLVLIGAAMFLQYYQMKQMNSRNPQAAAANPQMQQMQKFFPIIFGVIYLRVPAGATIYMVVSSAMRIGTQEFMFRSGMVTPVVHEREIGSTKEKEKPPPKAVKKTSSATDGTAAAKATLPPGKNTAKTNGAKTNGQAPTNGKKPAAGKRTTNDKAASDEGVEAAGAEGAPAVALEADKKGSIATWSGLRWRARPSKKRPNRHSINSVSLRATPRSLWWTSPRRACSDGSGSRPGSGPVFVLWGPGLAGSAPDGTVAAGPARAVKEVVRAVSALRQVEPDATGRRAPPQATRRQASTNGTGTTTSGTGSGTSRSARRRRNRSKATTTGAASVESSSNGSGGPSADKAPKRSTETKETEDMAEGMTLEEQGEVGRAFVADLLGEFGMQGTVETRLLDEDTVEIAALGEDLGILVGPRGSTLAALQDLTRAVVQRQCPSRTDRILVDVAGYRERRSAALKRFSVQIAEEVLASGQEKALEPMSPADRKAVHDAINEMPGVQTRSEGEDPNRHIVIAPAD